VNKVVALWLLFDGRNFNHNNENTLATSRSYSYDCQRGSLDWIVILNFWMIYADLTFGLQGPISIAFYDPWKQKPKNKFTVLSDDTKGQHASLTIHKRYNWLQKTFEFQKQFQFQKNCSVKSSDFNQPSIHNAEQWLHLCTTIIHYSIQSFSWSLIFVMHQKLQIPGFIVLQI
jgi:hypothetical protein